MCSEGPAEGAAVQTAPDDGPKVSGTKEAEPGAIERKAGTEGGNGWTNAVGEGEKEAGIEGGNGLKNVVVADDKEAGTEGGNGLRKAVGEGEGEAEARSEAVAGSVTFKKRKSTKKRLRGAAEPEPESQKSAGDGPENDQDGGNPGEEHRRDELEALVEAQRLRQRMRRWQANAAESVSRAPIGRFDEEDEPLIAGLRSNFAAERENEDLEQQCEKYISEKMADKGFGSAELVKDVRINDASEDLYRIPEELRMNERPAYDPGEGLPAAGLEEVDLDDAARLQNEEETRRALRTMRRGKARATDHIVAEQFRKRFKR